MSAPWNETGATDPVSRMLDVDVQTYLPGDLLVKMDIATMAHSLEVRSPFLDHVLMERVARLPSSMKLRRGKLKFLLKEATRPWLPASVIDRPKMGFGVPIASWFRGTLRSLPEDVLLDPVGHRPGHLQARAGEALIDDHRAGDTRQRQQAVVAARARAVVSDLHRSPRADARVALTLRR